MDKPEPSAEDPRRDFLKKASSVVIGGAVTLAPVAAGVAVLMDPLRRTGSAGRMIRVTSLEALPADGVPRKFPIIANRTDAWNRFAASPIGAIYLRRTGEQAVEALNVVCPHAGCFVDFRAGTKSFFCPCHNSTFEVDGRIADP